MPKLAKKLILDGEEVSISAGSSGVSIEQVNEMLASKQDVLTGEEGQVVGFDADGNAVAQDAPSSSGGEVYSTQERVIGTWIDGKPLYRKTYTFSHESGGYKRVLFFQKRIDNYNILEVVNMEGFVDSPYDGARWFSGASIANDGSIIRSVILYKANNGPDHYIYGLYYTTYNISETLTGKVTVEYTKSTD